MARRRTVDLLPEIFRTDTNRKFLSATLDQLTQEPNLKRTQGYVGRRVGPGVNPADNYVVESTATRTDYQLEPGVVFFKPGTTQVEDVITYPGLLDALNLNGANTEQDDRLFSGQYYSWDPFCDLDKFTNYSQYYWLPEGPLEVDVSATALPTTDDFVITRGAMSYTFSGLSGDNPIITLVRGGNYQFRVNQPGHGFWIQAASGVDGVMPATPNISSRDMLGVTNNGEDGGVINFNVPLANAQDFFYNLPEIGVIPGRPSNSAGTVDLVTDIKFDEINNVYVSEFLSQHPNGIDGITSLNGRTVVFTNRNTDAEVGGWQINTLFDPLPRDNSNNGQAGSYDSLSFDQTTDITSTAQRYSVWQITYRTDASGDSYMTLTSVLDIPTFSQFQVLFGKQWSSTQWYKNASEFIEKIPLLTAAQDVLWYQDSSNPALFGQIKLINPGEVSFIDINDVIGAKNYTSPNGVVFTNGLKIQFRGTVYPASFQERQYYVEGVGTGLGIETRVGFVDGTCYYGPFHVHQGQKMTGAVHQSTFHQFIYDTVEESLANIGAGGPVGASLPLEPQMGALIGTGIRLLAVDDFVTPEPYTRSATVPYDSLPYDVGNYDSTLNAPIVADYLTINRGSNDRNAWSRSNRWFHVDVIRYSTDRNNTTVVLDNAQRAKRPIIEFRANLALWNSGQQGKNAINIIDFANTDAFSTVNGQISYGVDGYEFLDGSRVIFAADQDPQVRNRIYQVQFIDPDGVSESPKIINLVPAADSVVLANQSVVCLSGITLQGKSFWYDGAIWQEAQEKTSVNQPPLFDIFDANGHSLGNPDVYPSTNFRGNRLFGYAVTPGGIVDGVLGFALRYLNINNVGDIVFHNYLYTDTFDYVVDNVGTQAPIGSGFVRQFIDRVSFGNLTGWQTAISENVSRQEFRFVYNNEPLVLDIPISEATVFPPLQIFTQGVFVEPNAYTYTVSATNTTITLTNPPSLGAVIEVQAISDVPSAIGFYQVPLNLSSNPLNLNSDSFTLGTIRTHYDSITDNLRTLRGAPNGANNSRDLGNLVVYGDLIVQHSSPLALTGTFLREPQFDIINSLAFNSQEYQKYKARMLDLVTRGDFINNNTTQILDSVIQEISITRTENSPFYWSDMLPTGDTYISTVHIYTAISIDVFDTVQTYDFFQANYQGLLVYLNNELLLLNYDYTIEVGGRTITIVVPLQVGDQIEVREYASTVGSYVPNTPTKLGLYPAYRPEIYVDQSYVKPTTVIRGHDGSITVAYGDVRDTVLLEFEKRIFNNLKVPHQIPLTLDEVMPGQFRETQYTLSEINQILASDFLGWVGWNKLDYVTQDYLATNEFTYNYSQSGDRINGGPLLGAWRGIYNYFYDTTAPDIRPWEMLGFSQAPPWWQDTYGPAPYTSGNLVLWEDLEAGIVRDPMGEYVLPRFRRPGLTRVIPVGSEGELLSPLKATVGSYNATSFRRSWTFGDDGPTESAWRTSSAWPFAVIRLLALTKPAKFFSLFVDRDRYRYDATLDQYFWNGRSRLDATQLQPFYGQGVSRASYINWIVDYNQQLGTNAATRLAQTLDNIDVRLCWRLGAFSDKRYLKIFSERGTPDSLNSSLLLPDESYQLVLYDNQPFEQANYSSVIIQQVADGWSVLGYSVLQPYFQILASRPSGSTRIITSGDTEVRVATQYSNNVVRIPYGYVFRSRAAVCDFLLSYGEFLVRQGWLFDSQENGYIMNWDQMTQEFLYWSTQGWVPGSLINLNPGATTISITRPNAVAESLFPSRLDNIVLNQNRQALSISNLVIDRLDNTFRITSLNNETINYLSLRFTAWEHMVVLDNRSIFADLIYEPVTGARQSRVLVSGSLSADWNGTVNAPGFILNQNNIQEWRSNQSYTKGEIVLFKNEYWTASTIIQPGQEFNYNLWLRSDYRQIQQGLLPNAANSSDQLARAYSVYDANLEQEVDLFSYGLIGFRPREYMQSLNLDDVSQVNLYQQFLGDKGTIRSARLFSLANLGKETSEYRISEIWAIQRATYGANANRSYFELRLNEALLPSDPSIVQVINPEQQSLADQTVFVDDIWKSSYAITTPDILPTLNAPITDSALPSAGYVNVDDVDLTMFDLNDPTQLNLSINTIGVGTTIWVAKSNAYDWNVYRCEKVPGQVISVADNLDGLSLVTFDRQHGLNAGDFLIIRYFDPVIDGVYRVGSVPDIYTVLIEYTFTGAATTGTGLAFTLQTTRVSESSAIPGLPYSKQLRPGARVWVDNNGRGQWTVLEKTSPFTLGADLTPQFRLQSDQFGASIAQNLQNLTALIGAPGHNPNNSAAAPGAVYPYLRNDFNQYQQSGSITLNATDTVGLGNDIDIGNQIWGVVGASQSRNNQGYGLILFQAPGSPDFIQQQILIAPDQEFGQAEFAHSVVISADEQCMYIGAPGSNRAYAYGRVDVQAQEVEYTTDGSQFIFNWSDHIVINTPATSYPNQITVSLNNVGLEYGTGWVLDDDNIVLPSIPPANQLLRIARRSSILLDQQLYTGIVPVATSGVGTGAVFTVNRVRGLFSVTVEDGGTDYDIGDTITISGSDVDGGDVTAGSFSVGVSYIITGTGTTDFTLIGAAVNTVGTVFTVTGAGTGTGTAAENIVLTVTQTGATYTGVLVAGINTVTVNSIQGLNAGQAVVKISGDGVFGIGAVITGLSGNTMTVSVVADTSGSVQFYGRPGAVNKFTQIGSGIDDTTVFPLDPFLATAVDIFSFTVQVNNVLQRPFIDYDFNSDSSLLSLDLVFNTVPPAGAIILVSAGTYFDYVDTLLISGLPNDARFGHSVTCTTDGRQVMIGAPGNNNGQGSVYVFDRSVEKFVVTNAAQTTYTTVNNMTAPIAVLLNGRFLVNTDLTIGGTFTVDSLTQVTIDTVIEYGDVIEIETNQFSLLKTVEDTTPINGQQFGYATKLCPTNCSLYIGSPYASITAPEQGEVYFYTNQSRVYGTVTTTVANPTLTADDYIRINNVMIKLWPTDINGDAQAATVESLVSDINNAQNINLLQSPDPNVSARYRGLSNVSATVVPDVILIGNGSSKVFAVGTVYSAASSYTTVVYLDDVLQTAGVDYTYNNTARQITFVQTPNDGTVIRVVAGRFTLSVKNLNASTPLNRLLVLPGTGTLFNDIGVDTYALSQVITSPIDQDYAHFGQSLFISTDSQTLVVGAPNASAVIFETFDSDTTTFDASSTNFSDVVTNSGVVYTYDFLPSASPSITNPGQFVFGQQVVNNTLSPLDQFGAAVDLTTDTLLIGVPGWDAGDSQSNYGKVQQSINVDRQSSWLATRAQTPVVNINNLNTVFMYDLYSNTVKQYFDFFDPLQGRLLGAVRQNIDYIGAIDPAQYNVGAVNNRGQTWRQQYVGKIWWDTNLTRFIDPNQDDLVYASRRWGQLFPGSTVQIYQFIDSDVPPSQYTGPGIPRSTTSYVVSTSLNQQGLFSEKYYFWVRNLREVDRDAGKTLSINTLVNYIENPRASGIPYIAPLGSNAVAIYNGLEYIVAQDTVLHIEFDKQYTEAAVHVEYQLIPQDQPDAFLNDSLYRKLLDSFVGSDTRGAAVPDPLLPPSDRYGVEFRPRQSMFVNRFLALQNYLIEVNDVLSNYPVTEDRSSPLLFSQDPEPSSASGEWDLRVLNYEELTYQDLREVNLGYRYLVVSDATNNGLWTIYQVVAGDLPGAIELILIRVQNYDTTKYWQYVNWYSPGYNPTTRILLEVPGYSSLLTLTVPDGSSVKVTANARGLWEIYRLTAGEWIRVALENGTIEFLPELWDYSIGRYGFDREVFDAQYFDQEPNVETRRVLQAINQELLVGDLLIERNRLLILMFNYILSEQQAPEWLTKTSLIDVSHIIRELQPFQIYRQDNQDFVLDYIKEVKPYRTQIRQFNLIYRGNDIYLGSAADFDLPAYWDPAENLFVSPILDDTGTLSTTSSVPSTSSVWQTFPWNQWYQNYGLSIESVTVIEGGTGYTVSPEIIVNGEATEAAVMRARINSAGAVIAINVVSSGSGYLTTPVIVFVGGNGTGAVAAAIMNNRLVREITTTIKYDRYQYRSDVTDWTANTAYVQGDLVRYDDRVWSADSTVSAAEFDPNDWTLVPAASLSGVDRTSGFYVPSSTEPGLDLALLMSGLDYPGVQVVGPNFNQNTGFDVGNYDINPFDNISFGPEGRPTYDPVILDAIYESEFTDPYLGTLPTSINVDGGAFVDTYSSHAPEELVPGAIYDTLDMRVYTTPGADWSFDGHGFPLISRRFDFDINDTVINWGGLMPFPIEIFVLNFSAGIRLLPDINYTVDWRNKTITVISGVASGEVVQITTSGLGGGNQLYRRTYNGSEVGNTIILPVEFTNADGTDAIQEIVVFVNGVQNTNFTYAAFDTYFTRVTFGTVFDEDDYIALAVLGPTVGTSQIYSWSAPVQELFVATGAQDFTISADLSGTNVPNSYVEISGVRARPPEGVEYIADGSSLQYYLPTRGGYNQSLIADNEVLVYINNQKLVLGVDYVVDFNDGSSDRTITLAELPSVGSVILISVTHASDYYFSGNTLLFRPGSGFNPVSGDIVTVVTWNDTAQQQLLTEVFVGPTTSGIPVAQGYDDTLYDEGLINSEPGSFDYSQGLVIQTNVFETNRVIASGNRVLVSLNGRFLFEGQDFKIINNSQIELLGPTIGAIDVVAITIFTNNVVPGPIQFRIFQDMRGMQTTYRMLENTNTVLTRNLDPADEIVHVADASKMPVPELEYGQFGQITINGERISYRTRDVDNNTLSGLRRGTLGTAISSHPAGATVTDISIGNELPKTYQDQVIYFNTLADGNTTNFVADNIVLDLLDSTEFVEAVRVYVGGILQTSGYTVTGMNPVAINFDVAPSSGYQVSVRVLQGRSWYQPGPSTASDGVPLQETNTLAARFIRGDRGGSGPSSSGSYSPPSSGGGGGGGGGY